MERWKTDAQKKAVKKYHNKQAAITMRIAPEDKKLIDNHISVTGEGLTAFLVRAALHQIHLDEMAEARRKKRK